MCIKLRTFPQNLLCQGEASGFADEDRRIATCSSAAEKARCPWLEVLYNFSCLNLFLLVAILFPLLLLTTTGQCCMQNELQM